MSYFKAKCTKFDFGRPRPRWGSLQRSPRPPSWIKGSYFYEEEGEGREGKGKGGSKKDDRGRREKEDVMEGKKVGTPHFLDKSYAPGYTHGIVAVRWKMIHSCTFALNNWSEASDCEAGRGVVIHSVLFLMW